MRYKINYKNLNASQNIEEQILKRQKKIEKLLPSFPEDAVNLHVSVEKHPRKEEFNTTMTLYLPQYAFHAERMERDYVTSINGAFHELERQMKKFKSKLSREKFFKNRRNSAIKSEETNIDALNEKLKRDEFLSMVNPYISGLNNFIRRELYYRRVSDKINPDPSYESEILNETILISMDTIRERSQELSLEAWLFKNAVYAIEKKLETVDQDSNEIDSIERRASAEKSGIEDPSVGEIHLDFWQPDESLKLEDITRDINLPLPDELIEEREIQNYIHEALAEMPVDLRQIFTFYSLDGFALDEIAMLSGKSLQDVKLSIESAREFLRKKIQEKVKNS